MNASIRKIFCCGCECDVDAILVSGREIYPHRRDLSLLPFWKCVACGNFVGCHHKTTDRTRPLGCIATPEIKSARQEVHRSIDPIWKSGRISRVKLYRTIAKKLKIAKYHTADIRSVDQARQVIDLARALECNL